MEKVALTLVLQDASNNTHVDETGRRPIILYFMVAAVTFLSSTHIIENTNICGVIFFGG